MKFATETRAPSPQQRTQPRGAASPNTVWARNVVVAKPGLPRGEGPGRALIHARRRRAGGGWGGRAAPGVRAAPRGTGHQRRGLLQLLPLESPRLRLSPPGALLLASLPGRGGGGVVKSGEALGPFSQPGLSGAVPQPWGPGARQGRRNSGKELGREDACG